MATFCCSVIQSPKKHQRVQVPWIYTSPCLPLLQIHNPMDPKCPSNEHVFPDNYIWKNLQKLYRVSQKKVGSQKISNCSNWLNFEAKIKCNTIKPNVPKWRKTCTGLKFDLLNFYGPQSNIHTFWDPTFFLTHPVYNISPGQPSHGGAAPGQRRQHGAGRH